MTQLKWLTWRSGVIKLRDVVGTRVLIAQAFVSPFDTLTNLNCHLMKIKYEVKFQAVALLVGLVFLRLEMNQSGIMNINGVLFLLVIIKSFGNILAVINVSIYDLIES